MIDPVTGLEDWSQLPPPPPLDGVYGGGGTDQDIIAVLEGQAAPPPPPPMQQVGAVAPIVPAAPVAPPPDIPPEFDVVEEPPPVVDILTPHMQAFAERGRQEQPADNGLYGTPGGLVGPPISTGYVEAHPELLDQRPGYAFDVTDTPYSDEVRRDLGASEDPAMRQVVQDDDARHLAGMSDMDLAVEAERRRALREEYALQERTRLIREQNAQAEENERLRREASERANRDAADLASRAMALANDREDTNRWWNTRSTGQTIAAGLAAAMGGLLMFRTGGRNLALDFFERQVEQDIQSQRSDLAHRRAMLGMEQSLLHDRMGRDRQEFLDAEAFRLGSYRRAIDWLDVQIAQYDPAGTQALRGEALKRELQTRANLAAAAAHQQQQKFYFDLAKANAEAAKRDKYNPTGVGHYEIDQRTKQPVFVPHGGMGGGGAGGGRAGTPGSYPWVTEKPNKYAFYDPDTGMFLGNARDEKGFGEVQKNAGDYMAFNRMRQKYRAEVARLDGTVASYDDQEKIEALRDDLAAAEGKFLSGSSVSPEQTKQIASQYPLPRYALSPSDIPRLIRGESPLSKIDQKTTLVTEQYADRQAAYGIRLRDENGNWHPGTHLARHGVIKDTPEERRATVEQGFDRIKSPTSIDPQTGKRTVRDVEKRLAGTDAYLQANSRGADALQLIEPLIATEQTEVKKLEGKKKRTKQENAELKARKAYLSGLEERRTSLNEGIQPTAPDAEATSRAEDVVDESYLPDPTDYR